MAEIEKPNVTVARSSVAVIAIHGVGDPSPGSTGQAVTRLLVSQAGYAHRGSDTWLVPVSVVHEGSQVAPGLQGNLVSLAASPFTQARLNPDVAPHDKDAAEVAQKGDLGIQLNHYLLRGVVLSDEEKIYTAHRQHLEKEGNKVDVLDLYWGDLSGLSNAVAQIITELYAMVFHLCQLGRDAAQYTAIYLQKKNPRGTWLLANSQLLADFLFTKPCALLNILALVLGLWWLPLRLLSDQIDTNGISISWRGLLLGLIGAGCLLTLAILNYRNRVQRDWGKLSVIVGSCVILGFLAYYTPAEKAAHSVASAWMCGLLAAYAAFVRFSEDSNHGVRKWGLLMVGALVVAMLYGVWRVPVAEAGWAADRPHLVVWMYASLTALEGVLALMLVVWVLIALAMVGFVFAGIYLRCQHSDPVVQRGVTTGRIGFFISILLFLALTSMAWVLVQSTISESFQWLEYKSLVMEKLRISKNLPLTQPAYEYIDDRFKDSTIMFGPIAALLGALLLGATAVLFPSIRAEVKHPKSTILGEHLGHWLSKAGVVFTGLVDWVVVIVSPVILAVMVIIFTQLFFNWHVPDFMRLDVFTASSQSLSQAILLVVGGSAVGLIAISTKIFGAMGDIRLALDAALDVDRHFREFPDQATPRGRIAARLKSLLSAAQSENYERIVICAHSQGTVIVAELLRYLQERDNKFMQALPPIHLFTCGSPLRQLYAARFPALYEWLEKPLPEDADTTGPNANMLGVKRWTNAYSTGDYVGRWLWIPKGLDILELSKTHWENGVHRQICLGKGAHTHYYDTSRVTVAQEIDRLILR